MIVVYTAIFGGSDSLKPAPPADRCVCYTDDTKLAGAGWEIVRRPPEKSARRAARVLKMSASEMFPNAEASVWVDGSIEICDWAYLMADTDKADIACFTHPDRSNCYDEGRKVVQLRIAHASKVHLALEIYRRDGFSPTALSTTGLFFRKHTPAVAAFNALWRAHLDRFGTNDQVHVDYCAWKCGVPITYLAGHYRDNPYARYDKADHHRRRRPQFLIEEDCAHYLA